MFLYFVADVICIIRMLVEGLVTVALTTCACMKSELREVVQARELLARRVVAVRNGEEMVQMSLISTNVCGLRQV